MCIRKCLLFRLNFDQLLHPWFHYTHGVYIMKISFKSDGQEKSTKILISWQELKNELLSFFVHRKLLGR